MLGSAGPRMTVAGLTHPPPAEKWELALGQHLAPSIESDGVIADRVEAPRASNLWWISELRAQF